MYMDGTARMDINGDGWNFSVYSAWLQRQEDGITRLFWKVVDISTSDGWYGHGRHVFVWRIEGENAVFEEDYEVVCD